MPARTACRRDFRKTPRPHGRSTLLTRPPPLMGPLAIDLTALGDDGTFKAAAALLVILGGLVAMRTAALNLRTARINAPVPDSAQPEPAAPVLLPARPQFINRTEDLRRAISEVARGANVLTIEGSDGVGKSATAAELVWKLHQQEVGPDGPDFHGHTFAWVDAGHRAPQIDDICRQLALLTADQALSALAPSAKLDALRAHLARTPTVLLLDNVRLPDDRARRETQRILAAVPAGSLVVASIAPPAPAAGARLALVDLDADHVGALARQQARRLGLDVDGDLDAEFARDLHDALGGNPQLIEWFVRSLQTSPQAPRAHLEAVRAGAGIADLFAPVWSRLTSNEQDVLAVCALLRAGAMAEHLGWGIGITASNAAPVLDRLASIGLLTVIRTIGQPARFTCSPAWRSFVLVAQAGKLENLTARIGAELTRRLEAAPEDARSAAPHIDAVVAIIESQYDHGLDADLQRLFAASLDIVFTLGLFDDRIRLGALAIKSGERSGDHAGASRAAEVLSSTHAVRGEFDAAREAVALGFAAAARSGSDGERARQQRCAAFVEYRAGHAADALGTVTGAEEAAGGVGDLETVVNALEVQCAAHWWLGDFESTQRAAERCLRVCEEMPWRRAVAYPMRWLAEVDHQAGRHQEALDRLSLAEAISREHSDDRQLARIAITRARAELGRGATAPALTAARDAAALSRRLGMPPELTEALAVVRAARRARFLPKALRLRRRARLTDAPVGGD